MKNKCTVIQINGLRGLLIAGFVLSCAIAGFVFFPAWCCQHLWNYVAGFVTDMPLMSLTAGVLSWFIVVLSVYLFFSDKFKIGIVSSEVAEKMELSEKEQMDFVNKLKSEIIDNIEKEMEEKNLNNK